MHLIQKPHFLEILSSYGLYTAFKIRYFTDLKLLLNHPKYYF